MFSAGISDAVRAFKTSGSGMAQAIQNLGASATTAQVPLEEQLSVLGMLQATMGGAEAGTKYKAFLRSATKGGEALGLKFTDANNQLLSKVLVTPTWKIEGAVAKVEACNNGFDAVPTWEDITAMVQINRVYNFTNKTKTASKWGVNIRFTITKNEGFEGEVSISGFGGAYE